MREPTPGREPAAVLCPHCRDRGESRPLFARDGAALPLLFASGFTDSDGAYHRHEPGPVAFDLACDAGHGLTIVERHACPSCSYVAPDAPGDPITPALVPNPPPARR